MTTVTARVLGMLALLLFSGLLHARGPAPALGEITYADLPPQAQHTIALIHAGGPFPYPRKDGSAFGNREGRLPRQPRGYYREYTVPTPGAHDRGPRRIIAGRGPQGDVRRSGEYWYTGDHYVSFARVVALPRDLQADSAY